jgi:hypothetical protein
MYRHLVLFRFDPATTEEQRKEGAAELEAMKGSIDEIRTLSVGWNAGQNPGNYDLVLEVGFDSADDFGAYVASPGHTHAWKDVMQPMTTEIATMQWHEAD